MYTISWKGYLPRDHPQENPTWSIYSCVPGFCLTFLSVDDIFPLKTGVLVFLVPPQIFFGIFFC